MDNTYKTLFGIPIVQGRISAGIPFFLGFFSASVLGFFSAFLFRGKKEGRKAGRKQRRKEGRKAGRKQRRKEGRKEGSNEGRKEGRKEASKEGRKEGMKKRRREVRKVQRRRQRSGTSWVFPISIFRLSLPCSLFFFRFGFQFLSPVFLVPAGPTFPVYLVCGFCSVL